MAGCKEYPAKFIEAINVNRDNVLQILVYEYRGRRYDITRYHPWLAPSDGSLRYQHRCEQERIDQLIEQEEREEKENAINTIKENDVEKALTEFLNWCDGKESVFYGDIQ